MKKIKYIALATLLGFSMSSCEDTLYDNVNPDVAHSNTAELGLPVVVLYASQVVYDHSEYGIYLSQCLTTMGKSQTGSYAYKSGWQFMTMNRHPQWRRHFFDIGLNANELIENSKAMDSPNYELIARTVKLMSQQLTTDCFGDMPRSEAYMSNSPKYDTQASIYQWMFDEIDALLAMYEDPAIVNNPNNRKITPEQDRVYGGDLSKWKGLVYAIKARLLLRNIPNVDRTPAMCNAIIAAAQQAIDQWRPTERMYGEWFGNEPRYNYNKNGVKEECSPWSESQPTINWESRANLLTDAVPSKFFMVDCLGLINADKETTSGEWNRGNGYGSDPRLQLLFVPQDGPRTAADPDQKSVKLRYLENNIGAGASYKATHFPRLFCGAYAAGSDAYNCIFTMEELYFIQAEAYYWLGNKAEACRLAEEATRNNIQRHLDRYLADNQTCYPAMGGKPGDDTDKKRFEDRVTAFFTGEKTGAAKSPKDIGNGRFFFDKANYTLSDLMTQKYIAMYMQPEQWTDMRRYHFSNKRNENKHGDAQETVYPKLRRPYNLYQAYWEDGLSPAEREDAWVYRLNYDPETEVKYNIKELQRLGAYNNHEWLRKPMNWAIPGHPSLTAEPVVQ